MCGTTGNDGTIVRNIFEKETVKHDKIRYGRFWAITIQHGQSLVVHSTKKCHLLLVMVTFHWQQKTKGLNYLSKFLALLQYIHLCTSIWNVAALIHLFSKHHLHPQIFFWTNPFSGVGKCPNWTSPNYWGYNHQTNTCFGDVQNPQNRTFTTGWCPPVMFVGL